MSAERQARRSHDQQLGLGSGLWTRVANLRTRLVRELLKVLLEALRQIRRLFVVCCLVLPRVPWVQNLCRYARHRLWDPDTKDRILRRRDVIQLACKSGIDHRTGMRKVHAFANAVWPTGPAGIYQPAA